MGLLHPPALPRSVEAIVPPATCRPCTLDDARAVVPAPHVDERALARLVDTVGEALDGPSGLGRPAGLATWREMTHGSGTAYLSVRAWPIVEVQTVTIDGRPIDTAAVEPVAQYTAGGYAPRLLRWADGWPAGAEIDVIYRAGWIMPAQLATWQPGRAWPIPPAHDGDPQAMWTHVDGTAYVVHVVGAAGDEPPGWASAVDSLTYDESMIWRATRATPLPQGVVQAALWTIEQLYADGVRAYDLEREGDGDGFRQYKVGVARTFTAHASRILRTYR